MDWNSSPELCGIYHTRGQGHVLPFKMRDDFCDFSERFARLPFKAHLTFQKYCIICMMNLDLFDKSD